MKSGRVADHYRCDFVKMCADCKTKCPAVERLKVPSSPNRQHVQSQLSASIELLTKYQKWYNLPLLFSAVNRQTVFQQQFSSCQRPVSFRQAPHLLSGRPTSPPLKHMITAGAISLVFSGST